MGAQGLIDSGVKACDVIHITSQSEWQSWSGAGLDFAGCEFGRRWPEDADSKGLGA
jgi:hypothetical protein